jgi:hypothetical protein
MLSPCVSLMAPKHQYRAGDNLVSGGIVASCAASEDCEPSWREPRDERAIGDALLANCDLPSNAVFQRDRKFGNRRMAHGPASQRHAQIYRQVFDLHVERALIRCREVESRNEACRQLLEVKGGGRLARRETTNPY